MVCIQIFGSSARCFTDEHAPWGKKGKAYRQLHFTHKHLNVIQLLGHYFVMIQVNGSTHMCIYIIILIYLLTYEEKQYIK